MHENPPQKLNQRDSKLIESLLTQTLKPHSDNNAKRVERLLRSIRQDGSTGSPPEVQRRRGLSWFPVSLAAAALVLVILILQPAGTQNTALAAVERSILAEQKPVSREYQITVVHRSKPGRRAPRKHTLFVRQRNFAIRTTPLLGKGEIWIGGREDERWIVPRFGPVQIGGEDLIRRPLPGKQTFETPFMKVTTILEKMKRFYRLELKREELVSVDGESILCDRIVGKRIDGIRVAIPQHVELWTDTTSGFARQITLRWADDNEDSHWLEATARLVGTPDLAPDFFEHTSHHEADRAVNQFSE